MRLRAAALGALTGCGRWLERILATGQTKSEIRLTNDSPKYTGES